MSDLPYAARYLIPYVRPFNLWKYGERTNLFGERVDDGWYIDRYGEREITREQAEQIHAQQS